MVLFGKWYIIPFIVRSAPNSILMAWYKTSRGAVLAFDWSQSRVELLLRSFPAGQIVSPNSASPKSPPEKPEDALLPLDGAVIKINNLARQWRPPSNRGCRPPKMITVPASSLPSPLPTTISPPISVVTSPRNLPSGGSHSML